MSINSEIGLSLLTSLGRSSLDVGNMAKVLANADVTPQKIALQERQERLTHKLDGYDLLTRAFQGFNSQVNDLLSINTFTQKQAVSSDESVLSAKVSGKPVQGTYQVKVQQLASAHTLATSSSFDSSSDEVGTGTLTLKIGGVQTDITVDSSNNTLEGIRAAINDADIGVSATIVNTGAGYKLMVSANQTGADHAIEISVSDDDGDDTDNAGLSQLINANMTETSAAQNAQIEINGLTIERSTNTMDDIIDGLTLELKGADPGVVKTINVQQDQQKPQQAVQDFVELYNSLMDVFDSLGAYDKSPTEDDPTAGALKGDSTLRTLKDQVRQMVREPLSVSGAVKTLADIGITTTRGGKLELDSNKLQQALAADPEAVGKLFAASMDATDPQVSYLGADVKTPEGTWELTVSTAAEKARLQGDALGGSDITLDGSNNTLVIEVNGTESETITLAEGTYTKEELAKALENAINSDKNLKAKGASLTVEYDSDADAFVLTSDKYGSAAKIEMKSGSALDSGVLGFAAGDKDSGVDVGGQLKDPVSGNTYTFTGQGQEVSISKYALDGLPKGLKFKIEGTSTGDRGTITFNRGYADRMVKHFNEWMSYDGVVGQKLDNLHKKEQEYQKQQEKIDARYEMLEMRYRLQFGRLQAVLDSFKKTGAALSAQLAALQPKQK